MARIRHCNNTNIDMMNRNTVNAGTFNTGSKVGGTVIDDDDVDDDDDDINDDDANSDDVTVDSSGNAGAIVVAVVAVVAIISVLAFSIHAIVGTAQTFNLLSNIRSCCIRRIFRLKPVSPCERRSGRNAVRRF